MSPEHDIALVRRSLQGDDHAFTELVRLHQDRVYSVVLGMVRNPDDAADVTQETFIAVLRHLDTFTESARFSTWLHRIAMRKAYDHLRRRRPEPVGPEQVELLAGGTTSSPQTLALLAGDLRDAVAALDPAFRDAVLLVDVAGASVEEAAAILDVAPGTIKSRVFRGRAMLAGRLGTLGYGGASE